MAVPPSKHNPLQPVERAASLGDRVYELLREYLRSGLVTWGEPLREAALAARLGVSRTPVREALARLASEGLAEAHGRSFTVPALTSEDLEDIYELRLLLETEAVRQAAGRESRDNGTGDVKRALPQLFPPTAPLSPPRTAPKSPPPRGKSSEADP